MARKAVPFVSFVPNISSLSDILNVRPDSLLADHLKPAAARAGIGNLGWRTFRHTNSTLLHALGTKPAVQKERLRHADIATTMNVYTQAISAEKREAASKVAGILRGK